MFESGIAFLKRLKENARLKYCALGTVAVFSPMFVACYGVSATCQNQSYDCIDGYVAICRHEHGGFDTVPEMDPAANQVCHSVGGGVSHWVTCSNNASGYVDSGDVCTFDDIKSTRAPSDYTPSDATAPIITPRS